MKAAVDSNVLLDVLLADETFCERSKKLLNEYSEKSDLIICDAAYAEIASQFVSENEMKGFLSDTGIRFVGGNREVLHLAGSLWRESVKSRRSVIQCPGSGREMAITCESCGKPLRMRQRILTDFVIGAHAIINAEVLLTRDRGFYRKYFKGLRIVEP